MQIGWGQLLNQLMGSQLYCADDIATKMRFTKC